MHRFLNHSILASLERILHAISNEKSNTENGDSEDYQKKLFKVDCTNGGHNTRKGNTISNGLWCSEDLNWDPLSNTKPKIKLYIYIYSLSSMGSYIYYGIRWVLELGKDTSL